MTDYSKRDCFAMRTCAGPEAARDGFAMRTCAGPEAAGNVSKFLLYQKGKSGIPNSINPWHFGFRSPKFILQE